MDYMSVTEEVRELAQGLIRAQEWAEDPQMVYWDQRDVLDALDAFEEALRANGGAHYEDDIFEVRSAFESHSLDQFERFMRKYTRPRIV